jgi:hypothetical protein
VAPGSAAKPSCPGSPGRPEDPNAGKVPMHLTIPGTLFECRYDGSMAKLTRLVPHLAIDIGVITLI